MTMMEMEMSFEGQNIWRYVDRFVQTFYISPPHSFSTRQHQNAWKKLENMHVFELKKKKKRRESCPQETLTWKASFLQKLQSNLAMKPVLSTLCSILQQGRKFSPSPSLQTTTTIIATNNIFKYCSILWFFIQALGFDLCAAVIMRLTICSFRIGIV